MEDLVYPPIKPPLPCTPFYAFLAQLDRALVYGTKGQEFESLRTHQKNSVSSKILDETEFFLVTYAFAVFMFTLCNVDFG